MPEIAEVARLVHFLRLHLVGKRIGRVSAPDDTVLFGKAGTTGPAFESAVLGKKVLSAGSQGKYFWITLDQPPHVVMHLGMTGWIHILGVRTAYNNYYDKLKITPGEAEPWPPRFTKFLLTTDDEPPVQAAFSDPRRFGRVRLVDCAGTDIRAFPPLCENGPDPVIDHHPDGIGRFNEVYLRERLRARHVPIKALLLDQTFVSGIGNWVADEVLFQAQLHPERRSDGLADDEMGRLYASLRHVCQTAVDLLADSKQFPANWLFTYRWGKGAAAKNNGTGPAILPNGERLAFITVGGRTSCYAPALQKMISGGTETANKEPVRRASGAALKAAAVRKVEAKRKSAKDEDEPKMNIKKQRVRPSKEIAPLTLESQNDAAPDDTIEALAKFGRRRSSRLLGVKVS